MTAFGSPVPRRLGVAAAPGGTFPDTPGTYTSPDGAIIIPGGALDRWFAWRATGGTTPRDYVTFGDSTWYGSGGNYSINQRLRDRAIGFGIPDGGKGLFAGLEGDIVYDAPEVNGFIATTWGGGADSFDTLGGAWYYDDSHLNATLDLQFRSTAVRLWYLSRFDSGTFTYSIDGGAPVTLDGLGTGNPRYAFISGLAAGVTHTIQIKNTSGAKIRVALAPINATGLRIQKNAMSGATFNTFFFGAINGLFDPWTDTINGFRHQWPLGLVGAARPAPTYRGDVVDTTLAAGDRPNPILTSTALGFNDLSNSATDTVNKWREYVKRFAGACYDASVDGIVLTTQLPYNAQWPTYGPDRFAAVRDTAIAQGLAFVDLFYPIGGPSLAYAGGTTNPHLTKAQYVTQADYLWDNLLGMVG